MVILYSTGCPKCNVLKKKLDAKHINYETNDSVMEMLSLGFAHAPVLRVNDEYLDFSEAIKWVNGYITEEDNGN